MNEITLTSQGVIVSEGRPIEARRPLMFLSAQVKLASDCTLRSYFKLIENYPLLSELNPFFAASLEQYRKSPAGGCQDPSLEDLLLTKTIEMVGFPGKPRLEIYHSLYGRQGADLYEIKDFPLENLLDMPLRLGKLKHVVFGDKVDLFEFDTVFTLFELIDAILWELSFHGTLLACEIRR
ncbi:MAG: hypothetical protein HY881_06290 [Deltaproteobacteria bacterium]|nr:hypothetical protein [Deltaproteobacteria bacterium]